MQSPQSPESSSSNAPTYFWDLCEGDAVLFRIDNSDGNRSTAVQGKTYMEPRPAIGSSGLISCIVFYMHVSKEYLLCAHVQGASSELLKELSKLEESKLEETMKRFRTRLEHKLNEQVYGHEGMPPSPYVVFISFDFRYF